MELTVEKRDTNVKAKLLRRRGLLPAIVYGRREQATPIAVERTQFEKVFRTAGESRIITLKGLGAEKNALIHDVALDAVTGAPIHADFYTIEKGQKVTVSIPLEFTGVSPAVKDQGGILTKVMHELEIECEPKDLPHAIVIDISTLVTLEDQIHVKNLAIPVGAKVSADGEEVVAMVSVAKEEPEEPTAPVDLSAIETSVERGKKVEGEGAAVDAAGKEPVVEAPKQKKE